MTFEAGLKRPLHIVIKFSKKAFLKFSCASGRPILKFLFDILRTFSHFSAILQIIKKYDIIILTNCDISYFPLINVYFIKIGP